MKESIGTNSVTGLNVGRGPHLIEDSELTESYNGWTDEDGVWRSAPGPTRLYSGYTAISCLAAGRMGGADHVVWMDGNTLYDNGTNVGTITAGTSMDIVAMDDVFLILGAAKNYIWDGTHLREQGAWQVEVSTDTGVAVLAADTYTINAITKATNARVTTTSDNGASVGDSVYIDSVAGMTQINGRAYLVTAVDTVSGLWVDLDCDSSAFTAYGSAGSMSIKGGIAAGIYKFYLTGTIELADGRIIEGNPIGLGQPDEITGVVWDTSNAYAYTVTGPTQRVLFDSIVKWSLASVPYFTIDGTIGVNYFPGIRLYRTKANGADFYLERSWRHGDADFVYSPGAVAYYTASCSVYLRDDELGAVLEADTGDHGDAPASTVGAFAGQRVLIASGKDIYWSDLDGIEYFNSGTGYTPLGDVVTAIAPFRDGWAVFSCDRLWLVQIQDGLPSIVEINTPVGTIWPKAMETVDAGVLFLRPDGLWLFNGARVDKVSRGVFASILGPASVASAGERLFVSGSEKSYVGIARDNGWVWHESEHFRPYADATNGEIYAAGLFHVEQLFTGSRAGGRLTTKHFGNTLQYKAVRVNLDIEGDTIPTVWVNGNRQSDYAGHPDESPTTDRDRRVVRVSVPRLNNQYVNLSLETTGDVKVYGYSIEVAR